MPHNPSKPNVSFNNKRHTVLDNGTEYVIKRTAETRHIPLEASFYSSPQSNAHQHMFWREMLYVRMCVYVYEYVYACVCMCVKLD